MKAIHAIVAVSLLGSSLAFGQDAPAVEPAQEKPAETTLSLDPTSQPKLEIPVTDEVGLIPEAPAPVTKPKGAAIHNPMDTRKVQSNKNSAAEDEMSARVRLRQLQTKVSRDPKVVELRDQAETATTDLEKREALKAYYTLFYGKIEKMDKSLKKRTAELRTRALHRLEQTRIDPTVPLDTRERQDAVVEAE